MFEMIFLGLEECGGVVVNGDGGDFVADAVGLAAAFSRVIFSSNFIQNIKAVSDLAKYRVAVVEERSGCGGDKELGSVGSWAGVCHGEDAGAAVAKIGVEFVSEFVAGATSAGLGGVAALEHEVLDYAVEGDAVVVAALGEVEEIGAGERGFGSVESGFDISGGGVDGGFDV